MRDELVGFELAMLAKSKGFLLSFKDVVYWYTKSGQLTDKGMVLNSDYSAPTQSLLQRWLREKGVIISINVQIPTLMYYHYINIVQSNSSTISDKYYDSYEQALENALISALKTLPDVK